jgi:hypothetical protein
MLCCCSCGCCRRRNPTYNAGRIVYCVVLGVLLGTIYLWKGQNRSTYNDVSNMYVRQQHGCRQLQAVGSRRGHLSVLVNLRSPLLAHQGVHCAPAALVDSFD